ncbi:hypothetical protein ABBQ32_008818 [Trebouxia sp. C0010 RCD-2024]
MTCEQKGSALGSLPTAVRAPHSSSRTEFVSTADRIGVPTIQLHKDRLPNELASEYGITAAVHISAPARPSGGLDQHVASCIQTAIQEAVKIPTARLNNTAADALARFFEFDSVRYQSPDTVFVFLRDHAASNLLRQMQIVELEVPGLFSLRMTFVEDQTLKKAMQFGILFPPFPSSS